ncbi:hypothetical protein PHYSODRAFT_315387 [Phytophthora sojae]|uniref:HTH CENPB-type domain-containing protein n=1 Tax=Phytophthora sojae (strain P6497) TaxID=1094619 RepID=G4ZJT3_PHYSP|nr:hypothetical protein PHYSODRAFT_315387 [Phytophthora sojae]EGZ18894.1 hypothetical protein PHYSODRAFT_315387 [Phytophthora sojae]|eukprot:XP_009527952.1 hypothetical protein PHYSODRAFT_315387 [Phytophthora sojae]
MTPKRNSISNWKKQEVINWINTVGEGVPSRASAHFRSLGWDFDPAAAPALGHLEDLLLEAIVLRQLKKEKRQRWIAAQALKLYSEVSDGQVRLFEASPHWISGFMKRYDLSLRRLRT